MYDYEYESSFPAEQLRARLLIPWECVHNKKKGKIISNSGLCPNHISNWTEHFKEEYGLCLWLCGLWNRKYEYELNDINCSTLTGKCSLIHSWKDGMIKKESTKRKYWHLILSHHHHTFANRNRCRYLRTPILWARFLYIYCYLNRPRSEKSPSIHSP